MTINFKKQNKIAIIASKEQKKIVNTERFADLITFVPKSLGTKHWSARCFKISLQSVN